MQHDPYSAGHDPYAGIAIEGRKRPGTSNLPGFGVAADVEGNRIKGSDLPGGGVADTSGVPWREEPSTGLADAADTSGASWKEEPSTGLAGAASTAHAEKWFADYAKNRAFQRQQYVQREVARILENNPPPEGATPAEIHQHVRDYAERTKSDVAELRDPESLAASRIEFDLLMAPANVGAVKAGGKLAGQGLKNMAGRVAGTAPDTTTLAMRQARLDALQKFRSQMAQTATQPDSDPLGVMQSPRVLRELRREAVETAYSQARDEAGVLGRLKQDVRGKLQKYAAGDAPPEIVPQGRIVNTRTDTSDTFDPFTMREQQAAMAVRQTEQAAREAALREQQATAAVEKARQFRARQAKAVGADSETVEDAKTFLDKHDPQVQEAQALLENPNLVAERKALLEHIDQMRQDEIATFTVDRTARSAKPTGTVDEYAGLIPS